MNGKNAVFGDLYSYVAISPNMVTHVNTFKSVVGHELIHAFHFKQGLSQVFGDAWSEKYAYSYSMTVIRDPNIRFGTYLMSNFVYPANNLSLINYPADIRAHMVKYLFR
ncbi:hypothetical protein LJB78_00790 [Bacteroidales bacterium OttesenSCG-928-J16]|nr:hypothetical protein [Bacteroidales bacterium OttesenSCG-928-J16]